MKENKEKIKGSLDRLANGVYTRQDVDVLSNMRNIEGGFEVFSEHTEKSFSEIEDTDSLSLFETIRLKEEGENLLSKHRKRSMVKHMWRIVAATAAILLMGWGGWSFYESMSVRSDNFTEVYVAYGTRQTLLLPDGTKVVLNAGSSFAYPTSFRGNERRVRLNGEAFFDVKRDEKRQFVIQTQSVDVKVLGTSFNVRSYKEDDQTMVNVKTGLVEVSVPDAMMKLKAEEQLVYNHKTSEVSRSECSVQKATAWMNNVLYFHNASIETVAHQLMRTYNCKIRLDESSNFPEKISGGHDNATLEVVLNSLEFVTGIRSRHESDGTIVFYADQKKR